jgi:histidine phosphotransferase ChpT
MPHDTANLSALIGSRICHDLISPIGAISNGLELLTLNGHTGLGPEFDLINDSCASASARIRFFRVAFGSSPVSHPMGRREVRQILADNSRGGRIECHWTPTDDIPRHEVQIAFLALLCVETALPIGGDVSFAFDGKRWTISASGTRINADNGLWPLFENPDCDLEVTPSRVQFALLDTLARAASRRITIREQSDALTLTI